MNPVLKTGSACALLLTAHACAFAQQAQEPVQQVVIKASANDQRERSTTTAFVVGRDEIVRRGDASLLDVLKRQPGITLDGSPGKAPSIRMRGMGGGYVAILLNGLPAPAGFSLESLSPDLVERIEIARVSSAETSGQAVAGTINVILRRAGPAKAGSANELKLASAVVNRKAAPHLVAQHSGQAGSLAYTLSATLKRTENPVTTLATEQGEHPALLRREAWFDEQVEDMLELSPRLSWQPNPDDVITSQSYLRKRHIHNTRSEAETTDIGSPTAFPHAALSYESRPLQAYADLAWNRKLSAGRRLAAKLSCHYSTREAQFVYRGMDLRDNLRETHNVASGPTERECTLNGSWRRPLWGNHALAAGWELGRKQRTEYRRERQTDAGGAPLLVSEENYRARVARRAWFLQDEWDIHAAWSAYAGLRREDLRTIGEGNAYSAVQVDAGAWSPIFQLLFKPARAPDEMAPRDQFRLAASRTYKAPNIVQLMPRRYTADNNNSVTNPDQQGNPNLRPELSLGIDLAWERYIGKHDMLGVSVFQKRIRDVTLIRTYESDGVWVATPENQGGATVRGIEFEGKTTSGPWSGRLNLARNWSRVDNVPGPDNRIEGQPAYTGNLALDYAPPASGTEFGASYTYRGSVTNRSSALLVSEDGVKRQIDLYALWKRNATSRLRLSVSDLTHDNYRELRDYRGDSPLQRMTIYRQRTTWRLAWEQSL